MVSHTPLGVIEVGETYTFDEERARNALADESFTTVQAVEPIVDLDDAGTFYSVDGVDRAHVDVDAAIDVLRSAAVAQGPVTINPPLAVIPTETSSAEASALAREVNEITAEGLVALVGGESARLDPSAVRRPFSSS